MENNENNFSYQMNDPVPPVDSVKPTESPEPKPEPPTGAAIRTMVFGILSLELAAFGVIGIIFAALARKWALPIIENFPYTKERLFAKAGRITGSVGLGLSIAMTVFWTLYIALIVVAVILGTEFAMNNGGFC